MTSGGDRCIGPLAFLLGRGRGRPMRRCQAGGRCDDGVSVHVRIFFEGLNVLVVVSLIGVVAVVVVAAIVIAISIRVCIVTVFLIGRAILTTVLRRRPVVDSSGALPFRRRRAYAHEVSGRQKMSEDGDTNDAVEETLSLPAM